MTTVSTTVSMSTTWNECYNHSQCLNKTVGYDYSEYFLFERYIRIIIPIVFGLVVILGLVGNLLVIIVILIDKHMRNTTNMFITSLAVADLSFIIFCVPFTAAGYVTPIWPFGGIWCKVVHYLMYVCCYASVYTLVVMTFDRFLAIVFPISSMRLRTQTNAIVAVVILWIVILLSNIPLLFSTEEVSYLYDTEYRVACIIKTVAYNATLAKVFYGSFFVFGYALPLSTICTLYVFIVIRLRSRFVHSESNSMAGIRSRKRGTRMVVIVVAVFALCWLPIHVIFMWQNFGLYQSTITAVSTQMAANAVSYMNSCVNPILYAFLSKTFRRSFKNILCCRSRKLPR